MTPVRPRVPFTVSAITAAVIVAGTLALHNAADGRVNAVLERSAQLRAGIAADEELLTQKPQLERQYDTLHSTLRTLTSTGNLTVRVATFVRDIARIATAHRTSLASIVPTMTAPATPSHAAPGTPSDATVAFDLTLDGAYADVLATVRGLATLTFPADVVITALLRKSPNTPDTTVRAALHVTLDAPGAHAAAQ